MKNAKRKLIVITEMHKEDAYSHNPCFIGRWFYVHDSWEWESSDLKGWYKMIVSPVRRIVKINEEIIFPEMHITFYAVKFKEVPDHGIVNERLLAFLKKNRALKRFVENCKNQTMFENICAYMEDIQSTNRWPGSIGGAFIFEDSNEGHDYWMNLYRKALREYNHEKRI